MGCLPDELIERLDAAAAAVGHPPRYQLREIAAYMELERRASAPAALDVRGGDAGSGG